MIKRSILGLALIAAVTAALFALWRDDAQRAPAAAGDFPLNRLGSLAAEGFARVEHPWTFAFPRDHGAHADYRTEWWYFTGVLEDPRGRVLGLQLVWIRLGLDADPPERASRWASNAVYAGLFSISDPSAERLRAHQRLSRAALGLAGASAEPVRVWVENWRMQQAGAATPALDAELRVAADDVALTLRLQNAKPLVDARALPSPERAPPFHFYAQPRLRAEGSLRIGERSTAVAGTVSLEHAWGELPLPGGPVARDRFSLYLNDGREIFCIRTHRVDGSGEPRTTALLVGAERAPRLLSSAEVELEPVAHWESERTGARYPIRWRLRIPAERLAFDLVPYWQDQEGVAWTPFWAGPVRLEADAGPAAGKGFVQLNGYGGA